MDVVAGTIRRSILVVQLLQPSVGAGRQRADVDSEVRVATTSHCILQVGHHHQQALHRAQGTRHTNGLLGYQMICT